MMANTVSYLYEILDRYSAPLRKITRNTQKFARTTLKAQGGVAGMSKRMDNFARKAQNLQGALGALGLGAALKSTIKVSSDMEDAMSDIGRVTDVTDSGLLRFESTLEKMSEELGKSKEGLAKMAFEGGKLGIPIDMMEEFLMMTSRTAIAFDMVDQEAGRSIGSIQAKMGLMGKDAERLLDSMNYLADTTSANGERMIEITERLSGTFKLLELPPEVAAAFAGFADQIEVTPQLAASGMNMMIRQMRKMPGMTTKLMSDPIGVVNDQLQTMADMGPEIRTKYVMKVFGPEAGKFVEKAVGSIKLYGKTVKNALSAEAAGSMQRELENQMRRSSKTFQKFAETWKNTVDAIGDAIKPLATLFAKILTVIADVIGMLAKGSPMLVQLVAIIASAVVAFTGLTFIAGLLAAALSPVLATLAAISAPIWAVIAAVTAITLLFGEWESSGHPIISMFGDMFGDIGAILKPIASLLGLVDKGADGFSIWGAAIEKLGYAIMVVLTPLKMFLIGLKGVVEAGAAIASGDFGGAMDRLKATGSELFTAGAEGLQAAGATIGMDSSIAALKNKQSAQGIAVTGGIAVTATGGAKIESSEIQVNGGGNMAGAM